jgi:hypothetical protein
MGKRMLGAAVFVLVLGLAWVAGADTVNWYVRGDGSGSDANGGTSWADAFATLDKGLDQVRTTYWKGDAGSIGDNLDVINVQASSGGQAYDVASRNFGSQYYDYHAVEFQGGWTNVDTTPAQSGKSVVKDTDGTVDEAGIYVHTTNHGHQVHMTVSRFNISDVTNGIDVDSAGADKADKVLTVEKTDVEAQNHGLRVYYPKSYYGAGSWGGYAQIHADDVDIEAGQAGSGSGHGIYVYGGAVDGSEIKNTMVGSAGGDAIHLHGRNVDTQNVLITDTVAHSAEGDGIYLEGSYERSGQQWCPVRATLENVTVADNGDDGVRVYTKASGSWIDVTDSIFATNTGNGLDLGDAGDTNCSCTESYNLFFGDDILVNGVVQTLDPTTLTGDPLFQGGGDKAYPYYRLASWDSPAILSDSDGINRGAIQDLPPVPEPAGLSLLGLALLGLTRRKRS